MNDKTIYPEVSTKRWALLNKLQVEIKPCLGCGKQLKTTKPIECDEWVGLVSESHGCDPVFDLKVWALKKAEDRVLPKHLYQHLANLLGK